MRTDETKPRVQIQLQLRVRALLFDTATLSLFLRIPSSSAAATSHIISKLNPNYLQLHDDDVYFTLEDVQQRDTVLASNSVASKVVGSSDESTKIEQSLLTGLLSSLVDGGEVEEMAHSFLQANSKVEICHKLYKMWNRLRPMTRNVVSLAAQAHILHREKEQLRINLNTVEDELKLLDEENKKLLRHCHRERKHNNSMKKNNKRKESPTNLSPIKSNIESLREPLASLSENSSDLGIQMK